MPLALVSQYFARVFEKGSITDPKVQGLPHQQTFAASRYRLSAVPCDLYMSAKFQLEREARVLEIELAYRTEFLVNND